MQVSGCYMVLREKWFRTLIHNISDIVALTDDQGIVRFLTPSIETLLGHRPDDVLGHKIFEFIHPEDIPRAAHEYSEIIRQLGASLPTVVRIRDAAADGIHRQQSVGRSRDSGRNCNGA